MALKFDRNFKNGRQSEQFLNDELVTLYEAIKYLPHHKSDHNGEMPPPAKLSGAINAQIPASNYEDSSLNYWDASKNEWRPFFARKFQITDQLLVVHPSNPVPGQLWINNGVLCYFDGADWHPIKSIQMDDSQWSNAAFADFELISPLNGIGEYNVPVGSGIMGQDNFIYHYAASFTIANPSIKKYGTDRAYKSGQSELTIHLNGVLLVSGRDYTELKLDGTVPTERGETCKGFTFIIDLRKDDVVSYDISRQMIADENDPYNHISPEEANENYHQYFFENEIDYVNNDIVIPSDEKWTPDWNSPELIAPTENVITEQYRSQFTVPNVASDRVFLDNAYDSIEDDQKVSSICFEYLTKDVIGHTVSAIHLNPGKLTGIKKRLIKVDKLNSTIAVSPYNTEFYGFRSGETGGNFLIPSQSQDYGDYIPTGDHIILNYHSNQNYDYILAITYEFTWMRADGVMAKNSLADLSNGFYLANLNEPLNIHVDGLKLEEASYEVNMQNNVVTIDGDVSNVDVSMWSPYKKQFGYIRETDLQRRGIIRLHEPVHVPLVFVGGTLIHPLYGGLVFDEDKIYVPNSGSTNQMINMQWCVVDLISDEFETQYGQYGHPEQTTSEAYSGSNDYFQEPDSMYYDGTSSTTPDSNGIYDYILSSGTVNGTTNNVIRYNTSHIGPDDNILLFIDGLLINENNIIRNTEEGTITITNGLTEDQEYVLLLDKDSGIYRSTNMTPALGVGYLSDSLVYLNGQILCNTNCVATISTPEKEVANGAVDHEIKYFITNEQTGAGTWKIYNQYKYTWELLTAAERREVLTIVSSYENLLTSIRLSVPYSTTEDEVIVYTFRFANDMTGLTEVGEAMFYNEDPETGKSIFTIGLDSYKYGVGTLNVYKNGVKLTIGQDYEEIEGGKLFRMLADYDMNDKILYMVEPIEHGYDRGHITLTLTKDHAVQKNIYKVPDEMNTLLYPGRLTVYVNGIRIPNTDWSLVTNRSLMLKYHDYQAVGSNHNFPTETFMDENYNMFEVDHEYPDEITIEIRYDYERQEETIYFPRNTDLYELSIQDYELDESMLESTDEVLFYLNGQFTGMSRNKRNDYQLDQYKGCISIFDADFLEAASQDKLKNLFDQDNYIYTAWKKMTGKSEYTSDKVNALTIVWR